MRKTLIVNIFGAPGSGKSTGAAYIFAKLKMLGVDAELVTEFAKDKVWEDNFTVLHNQFYVFGKQCFRLSRVAGKVDVIVTDSPILLSNIYCTDDPAMDNFKEACADAFHSYCNINFMLNRVKGYNPNGRYQSEEESDLIKNKILKLLDTYHIEYTPVNGCEEGYNYIIKTILSILGENKDKN